MKTNKKIATSLLTVLLIMMSLVMPAFAAENDNNLTYEEECQKVQELWDKAVSQGNPVYTKEDIENQNMPVPFAYEQIVGSFNVWFDVLPGGGTVRFYLAADINGGTFGSIHNFVMYNGAWVISVDNVNYQVTYLDGGRTIAINCSGTATATTTGHVQQTKPFNKYIEFYAGSKSCRVY